MDHSFTKKIQDWLSLPKGKRDLQKGALYLLQLTNNQILYRNITANITRHEDDIDYQLRKYVKFRLANLTHEQVVQMQKMADAIVERNHLTGSPKTESSKVGNSGGKSVSPKSAENPNEDFKKGKRADHDTLPEEIQARYSENLSLLQSMRNLHAKLVLLSTANSTCPDSERYPFLKEMIELDKRYHANWKAYDNYGKE